MRYWNNLSDCCDMQFPQLIISPPLPFSQSGYTPVRLRTPLTISIDSLTYISQNYYQMKSWTFFSLIHSMNYYLLVWFSSKCKKWVRGIYSLKSIVSTFPYNSLNLTTHQCMINVSICTHTLIYVLFMMPTLYIYRYIYRAT